jgi:hypothetical protein
MGHVRKGREARARRRESAVARQAEERARSERRASDVSRATGTAPVIDESYPRMTDWEIRLMLMASLPPRDPLWWASNPGI